ncbi:MAG: hypothetical protein A4S09_00255 [Proteobacteria bacterium SG_bin7]|nr:MAG: hypothetical protein A4S09_00255 [Proteobacteria bacterium SG_bin7]
MKGGKWPLAIAIILVTTLALQKTSFPPFPKSFLKNYPGFENLYLHEIMQPTGGKRVAILGSSATASWGWDYRWPMGYSDPWGRPAIATHLSEYLGPNFNVFNLAVNGGKIRTDLYLFLLAIENNCSEILYGVSAYPFLDEMDFDVLPQMNYELRAKLANLEGSGPSTRINEIKTGLLKHLNNRPQNPPSKPNLVSWLTAAWAFVNFKSHLLIGLPELHSRNTPDWILQKNLALANLPLSRKFADTNPQQNLGWEILEFMSLVAKNKGITFLPFITPTNQKEPRTPVVRNVMQEKDIAFIDADKDLSLEYGSELYDFYHMTNTGTRKVAKYLSEKLKDQK